MKSLSSFRSDPQAFLNAMHALWAPPPTATPLRVRLHGLGLYGVGVLCLLAFIVAGVWLDRLLAVPDAAYLLVPLYVAAVALCMIGGYRFVAGHAPVSDGVRGFSPWRTLVGLLAIFSAFFSCLLLAGWTHRLLDAWFPDETPAEAAVPLGDGQRLVDEAIERALEQLEQEKAVRQTPAPAR